MFEFQNPGVLVDEDLELVLIEQHPGYADSGFVPAYKFQMRLMADNEIIGSIRLRIGNTNDMVMYYGHIGYGVNPEHRGHRYAARSCKLLFALAKSHGLQTLWITCNPDNIASSRTCELINAKFVEVVDLPEDTDLYGKGERRKSRYKIDL